MRRRNFVGNLLAAGAFRALAPDGAPAFQTSESAAPDPEVKRVLVMFKCHLDVGFIDTQANVVRKYFDAVFPARHPDSGRLRRQGGRSVRLDHRLVADLQYLEKAAAPQRQRMEQAIRDRGHCLARASVHLADGAHGPLADRRRARLCRNRSTAASSAPRPAPR